MDDPAAINGADLRAGKASFTLRNRMFRALWILAWAVLARWTPPPFHGWRTMVLRAFGAQVAPGARIYSSVCIWHPGRLRIGEKATIGPRVTCYSMAAITIGAGAVISQGAHLCTGTHDVDDPHFALVARPIVIEEKAWICAEAFVGPGVRIGAGAVLGARGVTFRDLAPWTVFGGNPATMLRRRRVH
jgi:putative colanic acid biosynthesis acetyltransferase WcaF